MKKRCLCAVLALLLCLALNGRTLAWEVPSEDTVSLDGPIYYSADFINLSLTRFGLPDAPAAADGEPADRFADMKKQIVEGLAALAESGGTEITVRNTSGLSLAPLDMFDVYCNALYDYPEATWFARTGWSYYLPRNGKTFEPEEDICILPVLFGGLNGEAYAAAVDRAAGACFTEGMTDLEKVTAAHDWIATHCYYDPFVGNNMKDYTTAGGQVYTEDGSVYSSYSVFVNGKAVCQGYSLAFKVLMDRAGIGCCYVCNYGHAWNMVELDGNWYHVDCTWDDPIVTGVGDYAGRVRKTWFLRGDAEMAADAGHAGWTSEFDLLCPAAFALPEALADTLLPVMLLDGCLCLAKGGSFLCFAPGGDFAQASAAYECPVNLSGAAGWQNTAYLRDASHEIWELELASETPAAREFLTADENSFGVAVGEDLQNGVAALYTVADYDVVDRWTLGLVHTDDTMAAVVYYPAGVQSLENMEGKRFQIETDAEEMQVFLISYAAGRMCGVTLLTPDENGGVIPTEEMVGGADTVKLLVTDSDMRVLASAVELHREEASAPDPDPASPSEE